MALRLAIEKVPGGGYVVLAVNGSGSHEKILYATDDFGKALDFLRKEFGEPKPDGG